MCMHSTSYMRGDWTSLFMGHMPVAATPILDHLRSFTQVRGLVFGAYAEASPDVHEFIDICAERMSQRAWRGLGARSASEAKSYFASRMRRTVGVTVAREMARHRLRRIPFIGLDRQVMQAHAHEAQQRRGQRALPREVGPLHAIPEEFYAFQAGRVGLAVGA